MQDEHRPLLELFRDLPGFPFSRYFEDVTQFTHAQHYWLTLLRAVDAFDEAEWKPVPRPDDLAEDMYLGKVLELYAPRLGKAMSIQTFSLEGDIHMAIRENGPMDEAHVPAGLDEDTRSRIIDGIPQDTLRRDTIAEHQPFMAWVEPGIVWQPEAGHPEGGREIAIERLILTATIAESPERQARHALGLFLAPGTASARVNSAFSGGS